VLPGLLALLVFCACAVAGFILLRCRLPAAERDATGRPVCLACHTPAARLSPDSFLCPTCNHDVRICGLAPIPAGTYQGPLWRVLTFSVILCVLALVATALAHVVLPRSHHFSSNTTIHLPVDGFRRMELTLDGHRTHRASQPRTIDGQLHADLLLSTGDLVTLEIQSPSLRYRVTDADQREIIPLSPHDPLDESAVLRWMSAGGLNPDRYDVRSAARQAYTRIRQMLDLPPVELQPLPAPPDDRSRRALMGGSTSIGGGQSASADVPEFVLPYSMIFWSVLWLAGVAYILRRRPTSAKGALA
jgi:hypothetical protein